MANKKPNREHFEEKLEDAKINVGTFLTLHNLWMSLTEEERSEVINNEGCF